MRDPLAPIIAGFDCSGLVNRYSMQCEIVEREGGNGGLLRDGTEVKDILARKIRLSWTLNALSAAQYAALRDAAGVSGAVAATVYDPSADETRTADFYVTLPVFVYAFTPDGWRHMAQAGQALILEEA